MSETDDDVPNDTPAAPFEPKAPLLDYPSAPTIPADTGTEPWSEVGRAMAIVFGALLLLFLIGFGACGVLFRGCR